MFMCCHQDCAKGPEHDFWKRCGLCGWEERGPALENSPKHAEFAEADLLQGSKEGTHPREWDILFELFQHKIAKPQVLLL